MRTAVVIPPRHSREAVENDAECVSEGTKATAEGHGEAGGGKGGVEGATSARGMLSLKAAVEEASVAALAALQGRSSSFVVEACEKVARALAEFADQGVAADRVKKMTPDMKKKTVDDSLEEMVKEVSKRLEEVKTPPTWRAYCIGGPALRCPPHSGCVVQVLLTKTTCSARPCDVITRQSKPD